MRTFGEYEAKKQREKLAAEVYQIQLNAAIDAVLEAHEIAKRFAREDMATKDLDAFLSQCRDMVGALDTLGAVYKGEMGPVKGLAHWLEHGGPGGG